MIKEEIDKIIIDNLKLIPWTINKLKLNYSSEDEYQAYYDDGLEGLIKAAPKYNSSTAKASSFFYPCIKNAIFRGLVYKTANKRFNSNGKDISLYTPLSEDGFEIEDIIEDPNVNIEEQLILKEQLERLLYSIEQLPIEKDRQVIKMHYGLCGYPQMTFEQISKKFRVTRSAIQDREKRILPKLKIIYENYEREEKMTQENKSINSKIDNNPLKDLNNILFKQIKDLNNPTNDFEKELRKAKATTNLAQQIVANMNVGIKLLSLMNENNGTTNEHLEYLGFSENKDA